MKKQLLTLALAAVTTAAFAAPVTLEVKDATDIQGTDIPEIPAGTSTEAPNGAARHIELESFKIGDYSFTVTQPTDEKASKASYYYAMSTNPNGVVTVRMYAGSTLTVTAPAGTKMAKIEFSGSNGKETGYTCQPGTLSDVKKSAQTWTYAEGTESVTISYGAQFRITKMVITPAGEGVEDPVVPPTDPVVGLNATFEDGLAPWVNVTTSGDKDWYKATFNNNGYAAMTGFKGTTPPFEAWLISPAVDMSKLTEKVLTFETQVNGYGSTTSKLQVAVLTDANPEACDPAFLANATFATAPETGYSEWTKSGDIDLSGYTGTIYIGFFYSAAEDANYATWCVDNVKLGQQTGETPVDPVDPSAPGEENNPYIVGKVLDLFAASENNSYTADNKWVAGYIVGAIPAGAGKTAEDIVFGNEGVANTNIVIAGSADCKDYTKCVAVQLPSGDLRNALNIVDHAENLGRSVKLYGNLIKYFGAPGLKNTKKYVLDVEVSGIENVEAADNAPVEYYNLQGIRVAEPVNGLYIRRQGNTATKVYIR